MEIAGGLASSCSARDMFSENHGGIGGPHHLVVPVAPRGVEHFICGVRLLQSPRKKANIIVEKCREGIESHLSLVTPFAN